MPFLKQSCISFANPKQHEAKQFSKILSKSLDPSASKPFSQWNIVYNHTYTLRSYEAIPDASLQKNEEKNVECMWLISREFSSHIDDVRYVFTDIPENNTVPMYMYLLFVHQLYFLQCWKSWAWSATLRRIGSEFIDRRSQLLVIDIHFCRSSVVGLSLQN
jgi:hypothetical protein